MLGMHGTENGELRGDRSNLLSLSVFGSTTG
jgi:hypothetical protein